MNAGTGLLEVEETGERISGSAGHALDRKYGNKRDLNEKLRIILVESMRDCRDALCNNILKNWPEAELHRHKSHWYRSEDGYVDLFTTADDFLRYKNPSHLGNSLFYFDPLLSPELELVERIASARIDKPFRINTEFLIFFFTSDWVIGRTGFEALPKSDNEALWTDGERISALSADKAFGGRKWVDAAKRGGNKERMEEELVFLYKQSLRRWFRFVQPLPFVPKTGQRYDLFCCSNFDSGMSVINNIYRKLTWPFGLQANNRKTHGRFLQEHRDLHVKGSRRPAEWKVLWHIMKHHIDGVCDEKCQGEIRKDNRASSQSHLKEVLQWLHHQGYIKQVEGQVWMWPDSKRFPTYMIDWETVKKRLDVDAPRPPLALKPEDLHKPRIVEPELYEEDQEHLQTSLEDF